jgi:hypothetical protein
LAKDASKFLIISVSRNTVSLVILKSWNFMSAEVGDDEIEFLGSGDGGVDFLKAGISGVHFRAFGDWFYGNGFRLGGGNRVGRGLALLNPTSRSVWTAAVGIFSIHQPRRACRPFPSPLSLRALARSIEPARRTILSAAWLCELKMAQAKATRARLERGFRIITEGTEFSGSKGVTITRDMNHFLWKVSVRASRQNHSRHK